jgi:hypothetical protein
MKERERENSQQEKRGGMLLRKTFEFFVCVFASKNGL